MRESLALPGAMALVVCLLSAVQVPLDLRKRKLSRQATILASLTLLSIACTDSLVRGSFTNLSTASAVSLLVSAVYLALHRWSPTSLGFGDVLLVIPLCFALSYQGLMDVLIWQLVSTTSAACHAGLVRIRLKQSSIAFGPHLLLVAVVVQLAGIDA